MNKTVELVNEWAAFEEKHPDGTLEDFCRYYVIHKRETHKKEELFKGNVTPPETGPALLKMIGRCTRVAEVYINEAIKDIAIKKPEDFYFMAYIFYFKNPKKTEVIYANIVELTTGLSILDQLKSSGYIAEKEDPEDKRSKRVSMTEKGEKVFWECVSAYEKVADLMFGELPEEDMRLCAQLLKPVENRHTTEVWQQFKGKSFEEVYKNVVNK